MTKGKIVQDGACCIDDMGLIPVFFYKTSVAMNPKLKGVVDPGNTVFDFKYAYIEK